MDGYKTPASSVRSDIQIKKLLRACKKYYDLRLDHMTDFRKDFRRQRKKSFLDHVDYMVHKDFGPILNASSVVNHLAALIQPKFFRQELFDSNKQERMA